MSGIGYAQQQEFFRDAEARTVPTRLKIPLTSLGETAPSLPFLAAFRSRSQNRSPNANPRDWADVRSLQLVQPGQWLERSQRRETKGVHTSTATAPALAFVYKR